MTLYEKIRVFKLYLDYKRVKKQLQEAKMKKIKAGIKSTEFWLALIAAIIPVLNQHLGLNIPTSAVLSTAGVVIAYIFGRSHVKARAGQVQDGSE